MKDRALLDFFRKESGAEATFLPAVGADTAEPEDDPGNGEGSWINE
jgi:hypothetical protein